MWMTGVPTGCERSSWYSSVLEVPVGAVMDIMGWSGASMATRYLHVPDERPAPATTTVNRRRPQRGSTISDPAAG